MSSPHRKSDAQDALDGVSPCVDGLRFYGKKGSEGQATPMLVIREMTWEMLVPKKGNRIPLDCEESCDVH